ncbi:hypothetical protein Tco_0857107 [Tanacetum coccineum]|uniref:Uncharacterized protein n=1 Tax=Tanacetum coccineum TaxID=301880 RepID=A0ABQ5B595_9ASTR
MLIIILEKIVQQGTVNEVGEEICDRKYTLFIPPFSSLMSLLLYKGRIRVKIAAAAPTHSAFIGAASSGSKLTYSDQQSFVPSVDQLEMEELDLKWQMAMLSLRINIFEKKVGRMMIYNNSNPCKDLKKEGWYSAFKVTEVKNSETKSFGSLLIPMLKFALMRISISWEMHAVPPPSMELIMPTPYKSDLGGNTMTSLQTQETFASCDSKSQDQDHMTSHLCCYQDLPRVSRVYSSIVNLKQSLFLACSGYFISIVMLGGFDPVLVETDHTSTCLVDRQLSAVGLLILDARPYFRPSSVYFHNMNWPDLSDPMYMNEGRRGTAGDHSTDNDIGIVDSGCSRSMTGNKEKLDDFVQVKGGIVKFGGGDEEFQLPDESQVVLKIPRERDLYTFSISELQPEQNVTCLVAKASLE